MQLFNALSQRVEQFDPSGDQVTVYVCGITPYDTTHLGHCFTYSAFDIMIRYMTHLGYNVRYVQNVTDIDDDILRKSGESGVDWLALGNRWTTHFIDDNRTLNIRPPDRFPRATDVIQEIIESVEALLAAGVAYESAGNVYFHVADDPHFGKLSRLSLEEMLPVANERGNKPDDPNKRDALDFVLWQAGAAGEPTWDSPWGPGRPGWHIECSTMSAKYLGLPIDIHGGGADLIFPHHECEIAQSEYATGQKPFTRIWAHVAMVRYQGEKMSKSLGNLVMVRDLLDVGWSADAIRLLMARHHYRVAWSYEETDLAQSATMADRFRQAVELTSGKGHLLDHEDFERRFQEALNDDLDSPTAVGVLNELAGEILSTASDGGNISKAQYKLRQWSGILGLRLDQPSPEDQVEKGWNQHRTRFGK